MPKKLSTGPELPYSICCGAMASSPDGNGVILFGGKSYSKAKYLDVILELKSNGQGWVGSCLDNSNSKITTSAILACSDTGIHG